MLDYIPVVNLALNLLFLPLLKILWDLKVEITRLNGRLESQGFRIGGLEDRENR